MGRFFWGGAVGGRETSALGGGQGTHQVQSEKDRTVCEKVVEGKEERSHAPKLSLATNHVTPARPSGLKKRKGPLRPEK